MAEVYGPPWPASMALRARFLEIAREQVGLRESGGPNRGPRIEEMQRSVGAKPGDPWCVAGVYWCYQKAAADLNARSNGVHFVVPLPRTAGVLKLWNLAPNHFKLPAWTSGGQRPPQPGTLGLHRSKSKPGRGHLIVVVDTYGAEIHTCEFNTNPAGSRDGDGVYERERGAEYCDIGYLDFTLPDAREAETPRPDRSGRV